MLVLMLMNNGGIAFRGLRRKSSHVKYFSRNGALLCITARHAGLAATVPASVPWLLRNLRRILNTWGTRTCVAFQLACANSPFLSLIHHLTERMCFEMFEICFSEYWCHCQVNMEHVKHLPSKEMRGFGNISFLFRRILVTFVAAKPTTLVEPNSFFFLSSKSKYKRRPNQSKQTLWQM